jgi:hypothetical protein
MICFLKGSWGCRDCAIRLLANATLIATGILATNCVAIAGSDSVGMTIRSDPDPDNFGVPKKMKYELNGAHTFDSGLILGGSFQYTDTTFSARTSQNVEGTIGYRVAVDFGVFSERPGVGSMSKMSPILTRSEPSCDLKSMSRDRLLSPQLALNSPCAMSAVQSLRKKSGRDPDRAGRPR